MNKRKEKCYLFVGAQCIFLLFISSERDSLAFHIYHPVAEYFISADIKMRSCLTLHRGESRCASSGILKSGKIKTPQAGYGKKGEAVRGIRNGR